MNNKCVKSLRMNVLSVSKTVICISKPFNWSIFHNSISYLSHRNHRWAAHAGVQSARAVCAEMVFENLPSFGVYISQSHFHFHTIQALEPYINMINKQSLLHLKSKDIRFKLKTTAMKSNFWICHLCALNLQVELSSSILMKFPPI